MDGEFDTQSEALADAVGANIDGEASIVICHGPPRCDRTDGEVCPFCYVVGPNDRRSVDQIMADMKVEQ